MADQDEDCGWMVELETSLLDGSDLGTIRQICNGRPVPDHLRPEVWQICLNVAGKGDALTAFDELFNMPEQSILREDAQNLVDKLGNDEDDKVPVVSDLESILTFYCKSRNLQYKSSNGWLEILQPMLALKLNRADLYNCFYALITKYIPRECHKNGKPYHLFRLLLLYHDPELCTFLDSKKITPDLYADTWFSSLFASVGDLNVVLKMWDVYFQTSDPFLVFFLALVIIVNAKDQIMTMENESRQEIADKMATFPSALEADDIQDFCALAQYYSSKTPQSFRRDYQTPLFRTSLASQKHDLDVQVSQALCLPVSISELLQANQPTAISIKIAFLLDGVNFDFKRRLLQTVKGEGVHYFVVDCRPAEQYNSGHLPTAFHLDANLMLQNPTDFNVAVQALFATQKQAIASGSLAGGEHLCFMGSGREEEDQYVHMVVANFLQKNTAYISVARGGYALLHTELQGTDCSLTDHNTRSCIVCNPDAGSSTDTEYMDEFQGLLEQGDSIINKLSSEVKSKAAIVKERLTNYIKNEQMPLEKHVSSGDKVGKRYRNVASVFSIGDEEEDDIQVASSDDERRDTVNIKTWLDKPEVLHAFHCQEVKGNGYMCQSHLLITESHLYILREIPQRKDMAWIQARRALGSIVKITSKKKHPEFITFKYGSNNEEQGLTITDFDRFLIPKAGEATKAIKTQIMKVLDALDS